MTHLRRPSVPALPISLEWPVSGGPVRKVTSRSGCIIRGKFPSWKMHRMIGYESDHERNAFLLLDVDSSVQAYCEQPVRITYQHFGAWHTHIPDIYVQQCDSLHLIEIKADPDTCTLETIERTNIITPPLLTLGYQYHLLFGTDLKREPRLSNAARVLALGRQRVPLKDYENIRRVVQAQGVIRWADILAGKLGENAKHHVCRMIIEGLLSYNDGVELGPASEIRHRSYQPWEFPSSVPA